MSKNLKEERLGAIRTNRYGSRMKVVEYNSVEDILVEFDQGYIVRANWRTFSRGVIKNPYDRSVYGVGYLGEGEYASSITKDGQTMHTPQYSAWISMLSRCYSDRNKRPGYEGCLVVEEWHNFQTFAKWYDANYYSIDNERMEIDKDILYKGNKVYGELNCIFVPTAINSLVQQNRTTRGTLPIGVYFDKDKGKYRAKCNIRGRDTFLGRYSTPGEAFAAYKTAKEAYIKEVAEEYKGSIPDKVYKALVRYEVSIDD